ncbi:MAG TPA: UpxY family transcription antiterminator [Verrucomicrobiae bacterium]|nr:UpxY family transcription antiterminator [Verrucomicrobiae bacterium]
MLFRPADAHVEGSSWYAAYTFARHEKRVAEQLSSRGIECFLPMYSALHRWKDRKVTLQLPLFPSYVFVRLEPQNYSRVLQVPGVAKVVGTSQRPTPLPDREVQVLMDARELKVRAEPYRFLTRGTRVRVTSGCFEGVEGFVLRRKGLQGIVVTLQMISSSFVLDVDAADLEPVGAVRRVPAHLPLVLSLNASTC